MYNTENGLSEGLTGDKVKVNNHKDSITYIDHSDKILTGIGFDKRKLNIIFKNNTANFIGNVTSYKNIKDWTFNPSVNQTNASIFVVTKYGSYYYYKGLQVDKTHNTQLNSFHFSIPYKRIKLNTTYLKYTGLLRNDPVKEEVAFLDKMTFKPLSITLDWQLAGGLKNTYFHIPTHNYSYDGYLTLGYSGLEVSNNKDFIPALMMNPNPSNGDTILETEGVFLDKFTSKGFLWGMKLDLIAVWSKEYNPEKPKILYSKMGLSFIGNTQKFEYHTLSDTLTNTQFVNYRKGNGNTVSYSAYFNLYFDTGKYLFGAGASYFNYSYGYANNENGTKRIGPIPMNFSISSNSGSTAPEANNHVEDERIYYTFFIARRIGFKNGYEKIDNLLEKVF